MHIVVRDGASLDEIAEPRDLGLPPADFIVLSFSDSDLACFRAAANALRDEGRTGGDAIRAHFVNLAELRHPISVDLFVEKTVPGTKAILLRLLGGLDYWRYGAEELAHACRAHGVTFAVVAGDGRPDPRLSPLATVDADELEALDGALLAGGGERAGEAIQALLARCAGHRITAGLFAREHSPAFGVYREVGGGRGPRVAVLFYRSFLLAGDVRPIDALLEELVGRTAGEEQGATATAYYLPSLKDPAAGAWLRAELARQPPDVIVNTTAFSARSEERATPLDAADCPVIQAAMAGSSIDAWRSASRGLSATDLAMHVVLPELDGRLFGGAISFKARNAAGGVFHDPHPEGISHAAELALAWARLRRKRACDRRIALVLSTYPGRPDQLAHAVGLDGPASAARVAARLRRAGYRTGSPPCDANDLVGDLFKAYKSAEAAAGSPSDGAVRWPLAEYEAAFASLPECLQSAVRAAWGDAAADPSCDGRAFRLPVLRFENLLLALQPERGTAASRKGSYHDPNLPPRHGYVAFYLWLRNSARIDALIHLGAHGTLEWLPGKGTALSAACAPRALLGPTPVVYPFIVNDPGEAAQAKRRLGAIALGHKTPPLANTEPAPALREVERLLDEYAAADGLDAKRRRRLARDILAAVAASGLDRACGVAPEMAEAEALTRIDAFLCDVKELAVRDGLHILDDGELDALVRALDGRFIEPGPAGAPSRGRPDVLPTGRNLFALDPRTIPTPLACENGTKLAESIVARYAEDHGEWPRAMVLDLWGSQTMRTGGEEFASALALLGVKPVWDYSSFRVTGFEILPLMALNRPRVDVTLRISGLVRDMFPAQLAFFHAAVQRVARCQEDAAENPLRAKTAPLYRIFGAPEGAYGAGVSARIDAGDWNTRKDLAESYIAASATAYPGDGAGVAARAAFEGAVKAADCFVHVQDHRETDLLSGLDYAAHAGGFAAAAETLGNGRAALYHGDTSEPARPRTRTMTEEAARVMHGRALSGRWIESQMRHGFRGAAELAVTVDAAFALAATAGAVASEGFEHLYDAYLADASVASFLARENGAALDAMRRRFKEAIARSLWRPRRNDLSALDGASGR